MLRESCFRLNLSRKGTGTQVADGADFQGDAAFRKQVHQCRIAKGRDAMTDALRSQQFYGFTDLFWATDFSRVNEPMKAVAARSLINRLKVRCRHAQFIAAN